MNSGNGSLKKLSAKDLIKRLAAVTLSDEAEAMEIFNVLIEKANTKPGDGNSHAIKVLINFLKERNERLQLGLINYYKERVLHLQEEVFKKYEFCDYVEAIIKKLAPDFHKSTKVGLLGSTQSKKTSYVDVPYKNRFCKYHPDKRVSESKCCIVSLDICPFCYNLLGYAIKEKVITLDTAPEYINEFLEKNKHRINMPYEDRLKSRLII